MSFKNRVASLTERPAASPAPEMTVDERRWAKRKLAGLPGTILSDRLQAPVACIVRDLSSTGAQIDIKLGKGGVISNAAGLPNRFVLILLRDECQVECKVAWADKVTAGVRFMSGLKPVPKRVAAARPAKK